MGSTHQWLFVPFCVLAVFFFLLGTSGDRKQRVMIVASSLGLTCLCMVPQVIHLLKETYYHNDAPPFVAMSYLFIGLEPLFVIGVCVYAVFTKRQWCRIAAEWRGPSK